VYRDHAMYYYLNSKNESISDLIGAVKLAVYAREVDGAVGEMKQVLRGELKVEELGAPSWLAGKNESVNGALNEAWSCDEKVRALLIVTALLSLALLILIVYAVRRRR
ncbi:MAG: hypothetical protein ABIH99_04525, partial [Candidatus Micrarchaeota archaeon]